MPNPSKTLRWTPLQTVGVAVIGIAVAVCGFETGRRTVDAAAISASSQTNSGTTSVAISPSYKPPPPPEQTRVIIRDIATVPFSELYDVLKCASREQLFAWAADLERLPRGPRRIAAVTAYYKSLIQVDTGAATEAMLRANNTAIRDLAIDAMTRAAPESSWSELAEAIARLSDANHLSNRIIGNWSCTDPVAVSKFMERHPETGGHGGLGLLMANWAIVDSLAAKTWMEQDPSRQTSDAISSLIQGWEVHDRPAAIEYAVANAGREDFESGINEMAYRFLRTSPAEATALITRLPFESAERAIAHITEQLDVIWSDEPAEKENKPSLAARWLTLPPDYWKNTIGDVLTKWFRLEPEAPMGWVNQLRSDLRDIAIADFCRHADYELAEQAITLGFSINDPSARGKALADSVRRLGETREKAIEALDRIALSSEQKNYLRKVLREAANEH
jgi:hypothetical protein